VDLWIDLARGPLFRIALVACILGLAYRTGVLVAALVAGWLRAGDRRLPGRAILRSTAAWVFPVRLLHARPLTSVASVAFHAAFILVPLFSAGHVTLWQGSPAWQWWPVLPAGLADGLALVGIGSLAALLLARVATRSSRQLTGPGDVAILALLAAVLLSGLLAAHPPWSPVSARGVLLIHLLLADLTLLLVPISKIAHCAMFPLARLVFEVGWHFPAATGRHVATALGKEEEPV
jgi:nitrate reductase gamma subunit